ncbi:uncharacterized protein PpBr36_10817 [Pyricularia pennisetigena]|uniref:uncharacterized protein n=1 Tax=Pyricularia pennisetigena TaxID=1578925 RepID=UPI00115030F6|nr:uncharacterized protein PpBr36_10817 [Pyricularia pennisetigena]TLS20917.1 hypothetical protein PpBr36_10817 [Pyricularia pennisetigena]
MSSTTNRTKHTPGPHTASALAADHTLTTGAAMPRLMYGTAWKKEHTADLVFEALQVGFRGIDTAAQPRHYREDLVGEGVRRAVAAGIVSRADLFLQTKYSPPPAQDVSNMPYDASLSVTEQVRASVASSLRNLAATTDSSDDEPYIDCLVLHSPLDTPAATAEAWAAMASFVPHKVRALGISNASMADVEMLLDGPMPTPTTTPIPPAVVQNRFYPGNRYEVPLRALCASRGVVFQAFWTLSGDGGRLRQRAGCVKRVAEACGVDPAVAQYALVLGLGGISILDGTTDRSHMVADLEGIDRVGRWIAEDEGKKAWEECLVEFRGIIEG